MKRRNFTHILSLLGSVSLLATLVSCNPLIEEEKPGPDEPIEEETKEVEPFLESGIFKDSDYLKVYGSQVKTVGEDGNGDKVVNLKGTNAGGYLLIERWMTAFDNPQDRDKYLEADETLDDWPKKGTVDHRTLTRIFTERFGKEGCLEIWEAYRNNFWTDLDFIYCADMGMNCIRLPFSYMNVDPLYNNVEEIQGQEFNFEVLDNFIEGAAKHGIYTILDLHGAYGSQNGQDHSGDQRQNDEDIDFYLDTPEGREKREKTIHLWGELTKRYKGNPAVAAFDILNEPGEHARSTTKVHWDFFDEVYKEIREIDEDRIVMFESCWDGVNLPHPTNSEHGYNWQNCIYSFHNYTNAGSNSDAHIQSMENKINGVNNQGFGVPCNMGEFTGYGYKPNWTLTLELFNKSGWSWNSWTYKINRDNDWAYSGWGFYFTRATRVVPDVDSLDEIIEKFEGLKTTASTTQEMRFSDNSTLSSVVKIYTTTN